jgi:hypothetical protein
MAMMKLFLSFIVVLLGRIVFFYIFAVEYLI